MLKYSFLAIGALLFWILLFIVYNSKPRYLSLENKIFRILLYLVLFSLVFELAYYITIHYMNDFGFINNLICRFAWLSRILVSLFLALYSLCLGKNYKVNKTIEIFKLNNIFKLISIIYVIVIIIFMLLPLNYEMKDGVAYVKGIATFFIFIVCSLQLGIFIFYFSSKDRGLSNKEKKQVIWVSIVTLITFPIQKIFMEISIVTTGLCLDLYILYFMSENPDIKLINELNKAKDLLNLSNNAKSDFLSNMSHEIRSPMNAIIGFSESILNNDKFDEEEVKKDINSIKTAGSSLIDIINNILDISKIENGKESISESEYSIKDICLELISIIETRIGSKKIKLIFEIDENLPSVLYGDKTKVYQILLNILTNAVKYTEVGKIFLRINGKTIEDKINLFISVEDTGYGIKKEDYDKLFNKFVRLDNATGKDIEGTGLGLAITKKMVNLLGGNITFTSDYEVGTIFNVELKQKIIDKTPLGKVEKKDFGRFDYELLDCSNYSVLIVDNNKLNLKVVKRLLEHYKFKISIASSGKECIYKIKEGNNYDLIFLDHMMPDMNGIEVLNVLKSLDGYNIPPIVALTANALTGMKEKYIKYGFDEYLPKPINTDDLNRMINKYFKEDNNV